MQTFVDGLNEKRRFRLTMYTIDQIRDLAGVDLLGIADEQFADDDPDSLLNRLRTDRRLLCQVLHVAIDDSAPEGLDFSEFCRAMDGDGLENAAQALLLEIIELFPRHKRDTLRRLLAMQQELTEKVELTVRARDQALQDHLTEILSDPNLLARPSGDSPENSASTPAPLPSDS